MIIIPSRLHNRIKLFRSCIKLLFYFDGTYKKRVSETVIIQSSGKKAAAPNGAAANIH